jgi:MFS family permease
MRPYLNRNFLCMYFALFVSWFGSKLLMISYVAFIFQQTASASSSAIVFAVDWLTNLFAGLVVSHWIDRRNAKLIIVWLNVAAACVTLTFLGFTSAGGYLVAIGIIFVRGLLNSSVNTARVKALVQLFTKEETALYAPVINSSMPVATAIAGAVGILILNYTSFAVVILIDAGTFLLAALLVTFVRPDKDRTHASIDRDSAAKSGIAGVLSAFPIIARNRNLAFAVFYIILSVTVLQATYETLVTVIPKLWFGQGPSGTAMFFTIEAIGAALALFVYQFFNQRGKIHAGNQHRVTVALTVAPLLCYLAMPAADGSLLLCCVLFVAMVMLTAALWAHTFKMMVTHAPEAKVAAVVGAQTAMGYSLMGVVALVFSAGLDTIGPKWTIVLDVAVGLLLVAGAELRSARGNRRPAEVPELRRDLEVPR